MSETKAAFADSTIRSLKNILYRYMENNGDKYIHKLTQFVTTLNSRRICSIDLIPKNVKNSDFLSILYSKPLRQFRKHKFKVEDRVRISMYDLPFRKGYKPQFTQEVFKIVAIFFKKPATYTKKCEQDETVRGKILSKRVDRSHLTMESFTMELVSNASAQLLPHKTLSSFTDFLPEQLNLDGQWEVAISEISYPSMYQNVTEGKFMFLTRIFQSNQNSITWNLVFTLPLRILLKP